MRFNLPNLLSLSRLPLAVLFVLAESHWVQGGIIGAAAATDFVDGWFARKYKQKSRTGALLDPVTDKLFVLTVLVTLSVRGQLGLGELLLLLLRDIYNTLAFALARWRRWSLPFQARFSGKLVTGLQLATILAYTVVPVLARPLLAVTVAAALYAIYDYTKRGLLALRESRRAG